MQDANPVISASGCRIRIWQGPAGQTEAKYTQLIESGAIDKEA
jgi:hypothetical protein